MRQRFFGRAAGQAQDIDYGPEDQKVRSLIVGDFVARFIPRRSRTKACDVWSGPMRVVKKTGDRTYSVFTGNRRITVNINDLKRVALPWLGMAREHISLGELLPAAPTGQVVFFGACVIS
jgi:hypothetical protein